MPTCLDCQKSKSLEGFYAHRRTGPSDICKSCQVESNALRKADPESYRERKATRKVRRKARQIERAPSKKSCSSCNLEKDLSCFRARQKGLYGRNSACVECERAWRRGYVRANLEEVNRKKRAAYRAKGRTEEERERDNRRAKKWHANNKARHNAYGREYYKKHREAAIARTRVWSKANPQAAQVRYHRYRYSLKSTLNPLTVEEWGETLEYFNHSCAYCLVDSTPMTIDHLMPIVRGGHHSQDNVVPACRPCNSSKGAQPLWVMLNR